MNKLITQINALKKSPVKKLVDSRIKEFEKLGKSSGEKIFGELCYCLLTANFNAERAMKMQKSVGKCFITLKEPKLAERLKKEGHRFPNARANFIAEARKFKHLLKTNIKSRDENSLREWLVKNVKGLGFKEASHFLRNIGFKNLAIIDFHIADVLARNKLIKKPKSKSITKKNYLEIEKVLQKLAKKTKLSPAALDLYLFYIDTKRVLK